MIVLNVLNRSKPLIVNGHCLIESGSTGIWLVDTREWYDLGAIYDHKHHFQGYYCDVTTPAKKTSTGYRSIDLLLDLAVLPDKTCVHLDLDEFDDAVRRGTINKALAERAQQSLENLEGKVREGKLLTPDVEKLLNLPLNVEEMRFEVLKARAKILKTQGRPYD